jgi:hypothetical protein
VLFVSGYSDTMPGTDSGGELAPFLPKPFSAAALIAAVEGVLMTTVREQ